MLGGVPPAAFPPVPLELPSPGVLGSSLLVVGDKPFPFDPPWPSGPLEPLEWVLFPQAGDRPTQSSKVSEGRLLVTGTFDLVGIWSLPKVVPSGSSCRSRSPGTKSAVPVPHGTSCGREGAHLTFPHKSYAPLPKPDADSSGAGPRRASWEKPG